MKKQLAVTILSFALLASACSGDNGAGSTTSAPSATTQADPAAYCAALATMLGSQPAGGFVGDEFGEAMNSYAAAVEDVARLAPEDQTTALDDLAEFIRDSAADPNAAGLAERAFSLVGPMLRIQNYASDECGIDVEAFSGSSSGSSSSTDNPPPPLRNDLSEIDPTVLAALNGAVPPGVELAFESFLTTDDEEYPVLTPAPVGWEARDFIGTTFEPGDELGFFTQMDVGAHCDGLCAPKDWRSLMEDSGFGPFAGLADATEVLRDETLSGPMGRLVAFREDTTIAPLKIVATRWDDRADRYFRCEARLDEDDVDLWEVFADLCANAIPLWIPVE